MQWGKGLQSDWTLKFSYWISLILHGQPYQAFKISTLKLFLGGSACWRAGFLHFYRLSQQKVKAGAVVSPLLTQTLTQVSKESFQNRKLMQSWTYLDHSESEKCHKRMDLKAFSVFRLARRELGGELAIYSQVLGKHFLEEGFLFYGTDIKQDVHTGS